MKRIISLTLAVLMLVTLLLTATSCELSMESMTSYTRLRDHLIQTVGYDKPLTLDGASVSLSAVNLSVATLDGGDCDVRAVAYSVTQSYVFQITLVMDGSTEKASLYYEVLNATTAEPVSTAYATVLLTHYTGNDMVEFLSTDNIHPSGEPVHRENATTLLNSLLLVMDTYTTEKLDMDLHELGFIVLSDKYMASVEGTEAEEDLGGAFSTPRLEMAGLMIVQGIGMVFLVLAILWLVLLVFKKVFYKDPAQAAEKPAEVPAAPAPVAPAPVAPAPAADDGALVAAITAAVAAYIESDPALANQFAGGFRVVSFKPTKQSRNR